MKTLLMVTLAFSLGAWLEGGNEGRRYPMPITNPTFPGWQGDDYRSQFLAYMKADGCRDIFDVHVPTTKGLTKC